MNVYEEREKQIRERWFKNHKVRISNLEEVTTIDWRNPERCDYAVRYVLDGIRLYVSGDIGCGVFNLTWKATLESFKDINIEYFAEKLSAINERDRWNFDFDTAVKKLEPIIYVNAASEELEDLGEELLREARSINDSEMWRVFLLKHSEELDLFDTDWLEYLDSSNFRTVGIRVQGWLVGLKMAWEQIQNTKGEM